MILDRLHLKLDGDHMCFTLDDFVNLQVSPAYFLPVDSWQGRMAAPWIGSTETIHLPLVEQLRILRILTDEEARAALVVR